MKKLKLAYITLSNKIPKILYKYYNVTKFNKKNLHLFQKKHKNYDRVIYNIDNLVTYKLIYSTALKNPGVLILNSFYFNRVFNYKYNNLYKECGYNFINTNYPLNKTLINSSKGVLYTKKKWLKKLKHFYYFYNQHKFKFYYKNNILNSYIESFYKKRLLQNNLKYLTSSISLCSGEYIKQRQLLVDISSLVKQDLKTGIQRVVKNQLKELIKHVPPNVRVEPIYLDKYIGKYSYFYAREFMSNFLNMQNINIKDTVVEVNRGDIFYGLDLVKDVVDIASKEDIYKNYKKVGVKIYFLVYDLLPITYNWCFHPAEENIHKNWLNNIAKEADELISISNKVKKELKNYIKNRVKLSYFHLGANFKNIGFLEKKPFKKPTFLMVGTIEPRKAHEQVIKAFEIFWKENQDINLVIIGKKGWMVDTLMKKINTHPKLNKNLFYLKQANDDILKKYYLNSWALIYPSFDEGFGLPIIEAAYYKLPIIARDKEVFREIANNNIYYFQDSKEPKVIYKAIKNWLRLYKENKHPQSTNISYLSWEESTKKLISILGLV